MPSCCAVSLSCYPLPCYSNWNSSPWDRRRDWQLQCETIQEGEPSGKTRETACQYQHSYSNNECATDNFDSVEVFLETAIEGEEFVERKAGQDERNSQASRI